jgi:NAD(P)-dependent dehydrogenase (short-subunit alcohol dehydrogenase family)
MSQVWLITGSGSGLGYALAEAALKAGNKVIAGVRRLAELDALVGEYGANISPVALDVRDEAAAKNAVEQAVETYGCLDVLVNNAGYQINAPFEQISPEQFRDVIETCLFGVVYTTRAAIPIMRRQRSGYIFQISSIGGRVTIPGNSPYHAAKWAVGGFSDSLADEVASFGVKVCTLEPGGMRTNFAERANKQTAALLPDYQASVGPILEMMAAAQKNSESDPRKVADVIVTLSQRNEVPKRLVLGTAAAAYVEQTELARTEEARKNSDLTRSTVASA